MSTVSLFDSIDVAAFARLNRLRRRYHTMAGRAFDHRVFQARHHRVLRAIARRRDGE